MKIQIAGTQYVQESPTARILIQITTTARLLQEHFEEEKEKRVKLLQVQDSIIIHIHVYTHRGQLSAE